MARETIGYVKLEWVCPNCGQRNPGPQKTCGTCGAPQPENVKFEQAEQQQLLQDKDEVERAKAGPDIHCPFCGARNPAGSEKCSQCGGDLKEAKARETGQVIGAFQDGAMKTIKCPHCGSLNPESSYICSHCGGNLVKGEISQPDKATSKPVNWLMVGIPIVIGIVICGLLAWFGLGFFRRQDVNGIVTDVNWKRSVEVEEVGPVTRKDWKDEIPSGAQIESCQKEFHHEQSDPAPNADKVCGTPYTVDKGSGYAEVMQDCIYRVYQDYCSYTVNDWKVINEVSLSGDNLNPVWPEPNLQQGQRLGQNNEEYMCIFSTDKGELVYHTSDSDLFALCQIGRQFILKINSFNTVVDIEPTQ